MPEIVINPQAAPPQAAGDIGAGGGGGVANAAWADAIVITANNNFVFMLNPFVMFARN